MTLIGDIMKNLEFNFNNISEFRRYLDKNSEKPSINNTLTRGNWTGTEDWEEFEDYLDNGNPNITADVRKHTRYYIDKFEDMFATSTSYQFDVVGEFFDIGAVMVGEPESWIKQIEVKDDKFIELTIQGTYPDGTNLKMVQENGSKVLAISKVLEQQGYLVRINMVFSSQGSDSSDRKRTVTALIKVKDYDTGLDFKKFGIMLGVPFFRRGFLRLLEIELGYDLSGGFGFPNRTEGQINLDSTYDIDALESKLKKDD